MANGKKKLEVTGLRFNETLDEEGKLRAAKDAGEDKELQKKLMAAREKLEKVNEYNEQIKAIEAARDGVKKEAEELLAPVHLAYEMRGVEGPWGNLVFYYGKQSRLDKKVLQEELVKAKVKLDVIVRCMSAATKVTDNKQLTMQLLPPKQNGEVE